MNRFLLLGGAAMFALTAVATLPLSVAMGMLKLDRIGVSAIGASGTIWSGELTGARIGTADLGDVALAFDPLSLLTGGVRMQTSAKGGSIEGSAVLSVRGDELAIAGATGAAPLALLRLAAPLPGRLAFDDVPARFAGGRCVDARGEVRVESDQGGATGPAMLSGKPACDGEALLLPLAGGVGDADVGVSLRLFADGRYRSETRVTTADPGTNAALRLAGFADTGAGQARTEEGRLWR